MFSFATVLILCSYLDEIKEPMDLGTISKNIDTRRYKTMGQLAYDIELVFEKWVDHSCVDD